MTTYASNPQYRAWGGLKHLEYGNGTQINTTYNDRLQAESYELTRSGYSNIMQKKYEYCGDGRLKFVDDELDSRFDRLKTRLYGQDKRGEIGGLALRVDLPVAFEPRQKIPTQTAKPFQINKCRVPRIETDHRGRKSALVRHENHFRKMIVLGFAVRVLVKNTVSGRDAAITVRLQQSDQIDA